MKLTVLNIEGATVESPEQDFDAFFREHAPLVYRTAYSVIGVREDAEDVLQTVFMKLLRRDCPSELAENVKGYLYRAAINEALKVLQSRRAQNTVGEEEYPEHIACGAGATLPEDIRERLWKSLELLGPEAAGIFLLRYEHDYTDAEIAKMLGFSRVKVAVTLYRSRALLKRLMGGDSSAAAKAVARGGRSLQKKSQTSLAQP